MVYTKMEIYLIKKSIYKEGKLISDKDVYFVSKEEAVNYVLEDMVELDLEDFEYRECTVDGRKDGLWYGWSIQVVRVGPTKLNTTLYVEFY